MFIADGCEHVDLVDRFYSRRDAAQHAGIYRALLDRHPQLRRSMNDVDLEDEESFRVVRRHYGESAAAEAFFAAHTGYDYIVSRAVLEHVYDPVVALSRMADALNGGGMLLHKVDLRDHGMFAGAFHELKFLEVPDWLYPRMTGDSGLPNRVLTHVYRAHLNRLTLDYTLLVTHLAGVGEIVPHLPYEEIEPAVRDRSLAYVASVRRRFSKALRQVSDEELSISGIFIVARKPG